MYRVPKQPSNFISAAAAAFEYGAALAGVACYEANNYKTEILLPDGQLTTITRRDSAPGTRPQSVRKAQQDVGSTMAPLGRGCSAKCARQAHEDQLEALFIAQWAKRKATEFEASSAKMQSCQLSGAERIAAVRERVLQRARL